MRSEWAALNLIFFIYKYILVLSTPHWLTQKFALAMAALKIKGVTFHSLWHSHASQLFASGMDPLTISRRLGHGSPTITLTVYGHLIEGTDTRERKNPLENMFTNSPETVVSTNGGNLGWQSGGNFQRDYPKRSTMPGERFELPTNGLQNRCSTTELTRHCDLFAFALEIATGLPPKLPPFVLTLFASW